MADEYGAPAGRGRQPPPPLAVVTGPNGSEVTVPVSVTGGVRPADPSENARGQFAKAPTPAAPVGSGGGGRSRGHERSIAAADHVKECRTILSRFPRGGLGEVLGGDLPGRLLPAGRITINQSGNLC